MKRRTFVSAALLASSAWVIPSGCQPSGTSSGSDAGGSDLTSADSADLIAKAKKAMFCMQRAPWEQGIALQAMVELEDREAVILMAHEAVVRQDAQGRLGFIGSSNNVTDPVSNGPGVLEAYRFTGEKKYKEAADLQYQYLKEKAPRSPLGAVYHVDNAPEIWSDSMFMCPIFLAWYGDFEDAMLQVNAYRAMLWNPEIRLYAHRYDPEHNRWINPKFWGGGNGWSAAAFAILWEIFPPERGKDRDALAGYAKELLEGCLAYMRPDGFFHDNINDPESFVETNLGQMLAYSIFKGVRAGWLDASYWEQGEKMRHAALSKMDRLGLIRDACGSPYFDRPGTSTEAQAFFIMMETARGRG